MPLFRDSSKGPSVADASQRRTFTYSDHANPLMIKPAISCLGARHHYHWAKVDLYRKWAKCSQFIVKANLIDMNIVQRIFSYFGIYQVPESTIWNFVTFISILANS